MAELFEAIKRWVNYDAESDFYYKHFPSLAENAGVVLRPMRRPDLKTVSAIEQLAYEFPWEPATFKDCFKVGYNCWIGERAGEILTYGICSVGAGEAHVLNICVAPHIQGQGYGRMMLEKLMEVAKSYRAETMFLEVRPSNLKAIQLYQRMGFNEIGMRKDYYPAKKGREDALVMARQL